MVTCVPDPPCVGLIKSMCGLSMTELTLDGVLVQEVPITTARQNKQTAKLNSENMFRKDMSSGM